MNRREFMNLSALLGMSALCAPSFGKARRIGSTGKADILGTARNCIAVNLLGAPSHMDTFDQKLGDWLPEDWDVRDLGGGLLWSYNIMPNLAERTDRFSLVRSLFTNEVNHQRAQFRLETAHPFIAAKILQEDIAPVGSILAAELDHQRSEADIYPLFISLDYRPKAPGVFDNRFAGFYLAGSFGLDMFDHPAGQRLFDKRYEALWQMDPRKVMTDDGDPDAVSYLWEQASKMMGDQRVKDAFEVTNETMDRYGGRYGVSLKLARAKQILEQKAGARFINIGYEGWDHHSNIYHSLPYRTRSLDAGLSALMDDLAALPGEEEGKTLLDETLIVVAGEFGRTPGELNREHGRHHHGGAFSALLAGGGIQGGRILGATDDLGDQIVDNGWSADRAISTTDLSATVLSAMGVDYTKWRDDTPSGRTYFYTAPEQWMNNRNPRPVLDLFN
ncbi:MAG: DUF1501 domain-containing protein [Acidobacteriota bacterium]|nr:DUF1501 domain-containing protein [Acidobacteriota bacterium]